jgi:hypothetical protein
MRLFHRDPVITWRITFREVSGVVQSYDYAGTQRQLARRLAHLLAKYDLTEIGAKAK